MILFVTNDIKGSIIYVGKDNLIVFIIYAKFMKNVATRSLNLT